MMKAISLGAVHTHTHTHTHTHGINLIKENNHKDMMYLCDFEIFEII